MCCGVCFRPDSGTFKLDFNTPPVPLCIERESFVCLYGDVTVPGVGPYNMRARSALLEIFELPLAP